MRLRHRALIACLLPLAAVHGEDCALTPESIDHIKKWIVDGVELPEGHLSTVGCFGAGVLGTWAGAAGGAWGGALAGRALDSYLGFEVNDCENGESQCGPFGVIGAAIGGMFGAKAGAATARFAIAKIFGTIAMPSRQDAIKNCYALLGVTPHHRWTDVLKAYRVQARDAHPDRGGSQEEMVKLNMCKEILFHAHTRTQGDRGSSKDEV